MMRWIVMVGVLGAVCGARSDLVGQGQPSVMRPTARSQTTPVPHHGDAADDPAVWIHPERPGLSLILGTDKLGGLHSYNADGSEYQIVSEGARPNNVDVLYGFPLGGRPTDIVVASVQASKTTKEKARGGAERGVKVWAIEPATRRLSDVTSGGTIPALDGAVPYGMCGYHSARNGRSYVFVTDRNGLVEQYELIDAGNALVGGRRVRSIRLGSIAEGCVADDELERFYVSEETVGIWRFGAEPETGTAGQLIARVGDHGLTADVEGLTIYYATRHRGYLIASSQGNNTYTVYERAGNNRYLLTIDPSAGRIDDVSDTDGIAVTSCPMLPPFERGMLVVQDGTNSGGNQNFKLYAWEDIARDGLLIDTAWCPGATR
jgi:3-phytase